MKRIVVIFVYVRTSSFYQKTTHSGTTVARRQSNLNLGNFTGKLEDRDFSLRLRVHGHGLGKALCARLFAQRLDDLDARFLGCGGFSARRPAA